MTEQINDLVALGRQELISWISVARRNHRQKYPKTRIFVDLGDPEGPGTHFMDFVRLRKTSAKVTQNSTFFRFWGLGGVILEGILGSGATLDHKK